MKITLAYTDAEAAQAERIAEVLRRLLPHMKARRSERHTPYRHIYLTDGKPAMPRRDA